MSYHVSILRTANGQLIPITRSEVERVASEIPGSRVAASSLKGADLDLVISEGGKEARWLTLQHGELWASSPNDKELQVMLQLAGKLGARVRDDELLTYRTPDDSYVHPDDAETVRAAKERQRGAVQRARWMPWIVRLGGATMIVLIAYVLSRL